MNRIQNNEELKSALTHLFYNDSLTKEMLAELFGQIIDYLELTPISQLISAEDVIRQAYLDSHDGMFGEILEEIGIAKAEEAAYMNGVAYGDEPYFQPYDDYDECFDYSNWELNGVPHPNEEMRQELDELPF